MARADEWLESRKNMTADEAIDDLMITNFLDPIGTPMERLYKLVNWETTIALDPQVSEAAFKLYQKGFDAGYDAIVKFLKTTSPEIAELLQELYQLAKILREV